MRTELERCEGEVRKLELKLEKARDLLSTETSQRKKAEQERDMMGQKWDVDQPERGHHERRDQDQTATSVGFFRHEESRRHILTRGRTWSLASPRGFDLFHTRRL